LTTEEDWLLDVEGDLATASEYQKRYEGLHKQLT
jgi:hypothetical protein